MSKKKVFLESCLLFLSKIFQRYNIFLFNRCYFLFSLHDIWWFIILFWHWLLKTLSGKNKKDRNVASSLSAKQVLLLSNSFFHFSSNKQIILLFPSFSLSFFLFLFNKYSWFLSLFLSSIYNLALFLLLSISCLLLFLSHC